MKTNLKEQIVAKNIPCDVGDMSVSENGLESYYWPLSNQERTGFGEYLMRSYADIIKHHADDGSTEILPYKFFGIRFLVQSIAVFQGDILRERSVKDGVTLDVPEDWPYWAPLFKEKPPAPPAILKTLQAGPEQTSHKNSIFKFSFLKRAIKLLDWKKSGFQINGLKIKPITPFVLQDCIIATQRTPLIVEHAQNTNKDVVFCRSNRWFFPVSDENLEESFLQNDKILENKIISMVERGYEAYGIALKPHSHKYLQDTLSKGAALMRVHYQRLLENPEKLPKEIWTGTTGQYWDTMLRVAVMQNGGVATAHDHGSGWSYLTHPMRGINELWGCNYFATFNEFHASEMMRLAAEWPHYETDIPNIKSVGNLSDKNNIVSFNKFKRHNHQTKTIFFMGDIYDDDRGRIGPGTPNNFLVDVQTRILSHLKDLNYQSVLKLHPETKKMPPKDFEEKLDTVIIKEPFGHVIGEADIVVFLCIYSTAFTECLATNVPMILVDFFDFPWTETGRELIEKRCPILKAEYRGCRGIVDKDDLLKAIQDAPGKCNNHEFYQTYFL